MTTNQDSLSPPQLTVDPIFSPWLARWNLMPDGEVIRTQTSVLLPVLHEYRPAMLKIATVPEERQGAALLAWWGGHGAARVLALEGDALLMERATGGASLIDLAHSSRDDEASRLICAAVDRLHAPRPDPPPVTLIPLSRRFEALEAAAARLGGPFARSRDVAGRLLTSPRDIVVLHGDIHHGNILDFGPPGWLAIDPKGLLGERGYDYANTFCNPDEVVATAPGRLARQASIVAEAAGLERERLLHWILAYAGLSAAWSLEDGDDPQLALAVAEIAANEVRMRAQDE